MRFSLRLILGCAASLALLASSPGLAAARSARADEPRPVAGDSAVRITMAADGSIRIDGAAVSGDAAVLRALRAAVASGKTAAVIACDKARAYGDVIHVMDLCKQAGITHMSFAVAP